MNLLSEDEVREIHREAIEQFGGLHGIRDEGAFSSAMNAVLNRLNYEDDLDLSAIAATYAYHLCQNHPFQDGNKRVAAMATETFLDLNGYFLDMDNNQYEQLFLDIASSKYSRDDIEELFRSILTPLEDS